MGKEVPLVRDRDWYFPADRSRSSKKLPFQGKRIDVLEKPYPRVLYTSKNAPMMAFVDSRSSRVISVMPRAFTRHVRSPSHQV